MSNVNLADFAIAPVISTGLAAGATTIQFEPGFIGQFPAGPGLIVIYDDKTYPNNPSADPAREVIYFGAKNAGANQLTNLIRGIGGTSDVNHNTSGKSYKAFNAASATYLSYTPPTPEWFGAKADGSTDDATAFNAGITKVIASGNSKLALTPGSVYKVGSTLNIPITTRNFRLMLDAGTIEGYVNGPIIKIADTTTTNDRAENITIEGGIINGRGATDGTYTNQNGIEIYAVIGCVLRGVRITNIPAIGILGLKSGASGSAYWNKVVFDHLQVRYIGKGGLQIGTSGAAPDDLQIYGGLYNNLGQRLTTEPTGSDAGIFLSCSSIVWMGGEVSAVRNPDNNNTHGYSRAVIIRKCSGHVCGIHFEDNCNARSGSYDMLLDTDANGLVVSGIDHSCATSTSAENGIRTTSKDNVIQGIYHNAGAHIFTSLVDVSGALNPVVMGLTSNGTDPTNWVGYGSGDNPTILGRTGTMFRKQFVEMQEMTAPAAPAADSGRLYMEDNGSGKTRLVVKFNTGSAVVIATQP